MPYKREATAVHVSLGPYECPTSLPFRCDIFCTKDEGACKQLESDIEYFIVLLFQRLVDGDLFGILLAIKDTYEFAVSFPLCERTAVAEIVTEYLRITA
jgi:hypothetical protein